MQTIVFIAHYLFDQGIVYRYNKIKYILQRDKRVC